MPKDKQGLYPFAFTNASLLWPRKNKEVLLLQCRFWIIHRSKRNNLDDQTQTQVRRNCNMRGRKGTQDRSPRPFVVKQNIRKESNKFFASSFFFFFLQNSKKWKNEGIFIRAWFSSLWLSPRPRLECCCKYYNQSGRFLWIFQHFRIECVCVTETLSIH